MSTQSASSLRIKVGDIARCINSKWQVPTQRLVDIVGEVQS